MIEGYTIREFSPLDLGLVSEKILDTITPCGIHGPLQPNPNSLYELPTVRAEP